MSCPSPQLTPLCTRDGKGRSPLARLLHALNQPLTGLQCSLELAVAGPRPVEHYVRTLREGLDLTGRMRTLVEAIRELVDAQSYCLEKAKPLRFDTLLRETVEDLRPVASSRQVHLALRSKASLLVEGDNKHLATALFRSLESALTLAREGSTLQIEAVVEATRARIVMLWSPGHLPEHSPFSRQELGLLIAEAAWERAGVEWEITRMHGMQTFTLRLPLLSPLAAH